MRKLVVWSFALTVVGALVCWSRPGQADGVVQTTLPQCSNAYAILGWSAEPDEKVWQKVGWAMYTHPYLEITGDLERGVAQKATFRQYGVRGQEHAVAYVMHCGHGGTCNDIATRYFRWNKSHGIPAVYCGPLPAILESPSTPSIPKPDLTDYYKPESIDDEPDVDEFLEDDDEDEGQAKPKAGAKPAPKPAAEDDDEDDAADDDEDEEDE